MGEAGHWLRDWHRARTEARPRVGGSIHAPSDIRPIATPGSSPHPADAVGRAERMVRRLLRPTATIAHRRNARASAQAGMFTVHGGKVYNHRELVADRHSALPRPIEVPFDAAEAEIGLLAAVRDLERAACCEILRDFVVPAEKKKDIREELLAAGISAATLFPDPEGYARYLGDMWRDQAIAFPRANGDHGR